MSDPLQGIFQDNQLHPCDAHSVVKPAVDFSFILPMSTFGPDGLDNKSKPCEMSFNSIAQTDDV